MTLELIISQPQTQITGNPECDNIQQVEITCYSQLLEIVDNQCNVPWIQANIQFLNTIKGVGISNIEKTSTVGIVDTYTITYTDGTTSTFDVTNGIVGADGRGIVSILKTSTQELTDTYTITYTDGTTSTFDVTNGLDGISIESITLYETVGLVDTYEIIYSSGSRSYFNVTNGKDGIGTDGRGILSIIKTSTVGLVDTYTITYSDSTSSTFDITNGTGAYEIYHAGGGALSEAEFNESITNIPSHIADDSIHHTIDDLDVLYEPKNSNIQEHIADTDIHVTTTDKSNWDEKADLDEVLKLDQTTPQTIQGNVNINGNVNAVTTNVNQSTLPSVNASQDAAILQDGSAFTGTDYVMPTNNVAVKFVASAAHTMGDFTIRVKSSATLTSTTASLRGYLYSDNAGSPGTLLATGNEVRHGSITTSYQELSLGTQFNLVAGITYWLVIRWNSAPTGGDIIFDSNSDTNGGATSANGTSWTLTNVRLRYRLRGRTFYGINAFSTNSFGVYGSSSNYFGVRGQSTNSIGVYGESANSIGVAGISTNNRAGYFIRNTETPTNSVPVVEIIQDHASDTNSVLDVRQDGTGEIARFFDSGVEVASVEKGGLGVFNKGVKIGDNTAVASVANEFAIRGRKGINGNIGFSVTEMCMPTDVGTWNWVEIVRNEWIIP